MNKPPNARNEGASSIDGPKVRPEFNEKSPPGAKADGPQKPTLELKPPIQSPSPPSPAPGGISNEARIEVKSYQMERFELERDKRKADKKLTEKKKISRLFNRSSGRER